VSRELRLLRDVARLATVCVAGSVLLAVVAAAHGEWVIVGLQAGCVPVLLGIRAWAYRVLADA
jgi:hypothetical protein